MRHAPGKNTPFAKYCTVVIVCRHGKPAFLPAVGAFCFTLLQLSVTDVTEVSILYIFKADYKKKKIFFINYNYNNQLQPLHNLFSTPL